jgi:hypothetical protein
MVRKATGRAVRVAFAAGLLGYGILGEVLIDNGKRFTDRVGKGIGVGIVPHAPYRPWRLPRQIPGRVCRGSACYVPTTP